MTVTYIPAMLGQDDIKARQSLSCDPDSTTGYGDKKEQCSQP